MTRQRDRATIGLRLLWSGGRSPVARDQIGPEAVKSRFDLKEYHVDCLRREERPTRLSLDLSERAYFPHVLI